MAGTPKFKVYDRHGEYVAATKRLEEAAVLVAFLGDDSTIREGHKFVLWTEGKEHISASESYDEVANVASQRAEDGIGKQWQRR